MKRKELLNFLDYIENETPPTGTAAGRRMEIEELHAAIQADTDRAVAATIAKRDKPLYYLVVMGTTVVGDVKNPDRPPKAYAKYAGHLRYIPVNADRDQFLADIKPAARRELKPGRRKQNAS